MPLHSPAHVVPVGVDGSNPIASMLADRLKTKGLAARPETRTPRRILRGLDRHQGRTAPEAAGGVGSPNCFHSLSVGSD